LSELGYSFVQKSGAAKDF